MKYFAVTDDPTELMHYGIKGMKWGVIRTDAQLGHFKSPSKPRARKASKSSKPRSPAYMKASAKLSSLMQHGIAKAQANWKEYNSPENKAYRDYKRGEKRFEKHVEKARKGTLKYKGISDDEVQRITDRLMLENRARMQSGNEKASFVRRIRESAGEGFVRGVGQGTAGYIQARMTGRGNTSAKIKEEKRLAAYHNSLQGRLAQWRENRADMRDVKAQQRRENRRAALRDVYADERQEILDARKEDADRRQNEQKYEALVIGNRQMGYDRIYGDDGGFDYKTGRHTRRLSDAELSARITNLEDTKKLYGTAQDGVIKARGGQVTREYEDENGRKIKETYSKGDIVQGLYGPITRAKTRTSAARNDTNRKRTKESNAQNKQVTSKPAGATEEDLNRMEEQIARDMAERGESNRLVSQSTRNRIRQAMAAEGLTPAVSEHDRYRKGMESLYAEKTAKENAAAKKRDDEYESAIERGKKRAQDEGFAYYEARRLAREANPEPYLPNAPTRAAVEAKKHGGYASAIDRGRKRAQDEGFAYYEARRLSREANPDSYLPYAPTRTMVEANKRNTDYKAEKTRVIQAVARNAVEQYRQADARAKAQARIAREQEQVMFNGRTIPESTSPVVRERPTARSRVNRTRSRR